MKKYSCVLIFLVLLASAVISCEEHVIEPVETELMVSVDSLSFNATECTDSIILTGNAQWNIESNQPWCTVSLNAGSGNGKIEVNIRKNDSSTDRTAILSINSGSMKKTVNIHQAAATLSLSVDKIMTTAVQSDVTFAVLSNRDWTVSSNQSWCTTSVLSEANGVTMISVSANTETTSRSAVITVKAGDLSKELVVTQMGTSEPTQTLAVSFENLLAAAPASKNSISIMSNRDWTVSSNQSWCTVSKTSGSGTGNIEISIATNGNDTERKASLSIKAGSLTKVVNITQAAAILKFSADRFTMASTMGVGLFSVTSNISWTISSDQSWCVLSETKGTGSATVSFSLPENNTSSDRTATLTIKAGNITKQILVNQLAASDLSVSPASLSFEATAGKKNLSIISTTNWTVTSNQSWCTVSPTSGTGNGTVAVTLAANPTTVARTAIITVHAGSLTKTALVAQAATSAPANSIVLSNALDNILEQSDFSTPNKIYEIRYAFNLNGASITLPAGCTLNFAGGSISNGTIDGNGCTIEGTESSVLCNLTNISNNELDVKMFREVSASDDAVWLQRAFDSGAKKLNGCEIFGLRSGIVVPSGIIVNNFKFDCSNATTNFSILTPVRNSVNTIIQNCTFIGNGRSDGNNQAGWAMYSGTNMRNILIENCTFDELQLAVSFNADLAGEIYDCRVSNCRFTNIRGEQIGHYGVHDAQGHNTIVENCYFESCDRHAVYFAKSYSPVLRNCIIKDHRKTFGYTGHTLSALQISRVTNNVLIEGNQFLECFDAPIQISSAVAENENVYGQNYKIYGNTFVCSEPTVMSGFIVIGIMGTLENGEFGAKDIDIQNNTFTLNKTGVCVFLAQARGTVNVSNNQFNVKNGQQELFQLFRLTRNEHDAPFVIIEKNRFSSSENVTFNPAPVITYTTKPNNGFRWCNNIIDPTVTVSPVNKDTSTDYSTTIYGCE